MVMRMVRSLVSVNSPFLLPSLHRALTQYQKTWGFLQTPLCSRLMVSSYSGHLSADNRQRRAQSEFRVSGVVQPSSLSQKSVTRHPEVEAARMEATSTKETSHAASTDEPRPGMAAPTNAR